MPLRFVNPNYHVILVHYPLGVFVLGVFLELFSLLWRKGSIRVAGVWMILIGAILSLPAATSGIYALWDVASSQGGPTGIIGQHERYRLLKLHVIFQSSASLLAVICAIVGLGASDAWRAKLRLPLLLGVTVACGMMVFGSWNGGETVYQQGTAVQIVNQNGELQKPEKTVYKTKYAEIVKYYIGGEKQVHIITAGFALSAAMAALGLSIRRLTTHRAELAQLEAEEALAAGKRSGGEARHVTDDLSIMRSINPEAEIEADFAHVPAGRWWLVSALVTLVTAAMGYWIMSKHEFATHKGWMDFLETLDLDEAKKWTFGKQMMNRHLAHLALGGGMIVLALILGLIARFAPRRPVLLTVFATLIVLVTSAQVWMGVALTFDDEGPLTRFNPEVPITISPSAAPDTVTNTAPATTEASPATLPAAPEIVPPKTPAPETPPKDLTPPENGSTKPAPTPETPTPKAPAAPEKPPAKDPAPSESPTLKTPATLDASTPKTPAAPENPAKEPAPAESPTPKTPAAPDASTPKTPAAPENPPAKDAAPSDASTPKTPATPENPPAKDAAPPDASTPKTPAAQENPPAKDAAPPDASTPKAPVPPDGSTPKAPAAPENPSAKDAAAPDASTPNKDK